MRFLLTSYGTSGDVNPIASVGAALARRGHVVEFATLRPYRALIERLGMSFREIDAGWAPADLAHTPKLVTTKGGSIKMLRRVLIPAIPSTARALEEAVAEGRPDAMFGHHVSFAGAWVAKRHRIPWATAALAPTSWPSIEQFNIYPGMPDIDRAPRWTLRLGNAIGGRMTTRATEPYIQRFRARLGYGERPAGGTLLGEMLSSGPNLGLWSECFRPAAGDDPADSHVCGFTRLDGHESSPASEEALAFADESADGAPVLITLGTSVTHARPELLERAERACARVGVRAIVLDGATEPAERVGSGLLRLARAPHGALMPSCRGVVHHGGIQTTAQVMLAGVPMVVVPFTHDQPDNAARCRRLGLGLSVPSARASVSRLSRALERVLDEPSFKEAAGRLRERVVGEGDGAERAADRLEVLGQA